MKSDSEPFDFNIRDGKTNRIISTKKVVLANFGEKGTFSYYNSKGELITVKEVEK